MNKNIFLYFILATIICSLTSCDVWLGVQGTVVDLETNKPIKGVHVSTNEGRNFATTDSIGYFTLLNKENQAFKKTKNVCIDVQFEREGYKPLSKKFGATPPDSIIYLERIK